MLLNNKDFHEFIESFIEILETKDAYTRGHSNRVAHYSVAIARKMNLDKNFIDLAHIAGHLRDIRKKSRIFWSLNAITSAVFA